MYCAIRTCPGTTSHYIKMPSPVHASRNLAEAGPCLRKAIIQNLLSLNASNLSYAPLPLVVGAEGKKTPHRALRPPPVYVWRTSNHYQPEAAGPASRTQGKNSAREWPSRKTARDLSAYLLRSRTSSGSYETCSLFASDYLLFHPSLLLILQQKPYLNWLFPMLFNFW